MRGPGGDLDGGFSLVEVIVSMVLLGLVAMAMLPVMVTGAKTAAANRDMSKASQYASTELMYARQWITTGKCSNVVGKIGAQKFLSPRTTDADPSSPTATPLARPGYTVVDTVSGSCTSGQTIRISSTVTSMKDASKSVSVTTLILVPS